MRKRLIALYKSHLDVMVRKARARIFKISKDEELRLREIKENFPQVLTVTDSIERIVKERLSVARFGDAEFDIALALNGADAYQKPSEELTKRLFGILSQGSRPRLMVCIPPFCSNSNNIQNFYKNISFWEWYWLRRYSSLSINMSRSSYYGNSFLSRVTVFEEEGLSSLKRIWAGRDVIFVVGRGGRFVYDERLFGNIRQWTKVLVPPVSAFDEYSLILEECKKAIKGTLFLVAAGPTATVLCADLSDLNFQAIDIGHISNCYLEYLGESPRPEELALVNGVIS